MTLEEALERIRELEAENKFLKQMQRDLLNTNGINDEELGKILFRKLNYKG